MHDMPVALVTGANRGIGLQIAKDMTAIAYPCGARELADFALGIAKARGGAR